MLGISTESVKSKNIFFQWNANIENVNELIRFTLVIERLNKKGFLKLISTCADVDVDL